jgi:membrane protein DedA with SNARE-associated domain
MFSTSTDILNIVLAICIAGLTVFLITTIYYVIATLRKAHRLINKVESGVSKTEELISLVKEKIKSSSTHIVVVAELVKQLIKFTQKSDWLSKKDKKSTSSKKKNK